MKNRISINSVIINQYSIEICYLMKVIAVSILILKKGHFSNRI